MARRTLDPTDVIDAAEIPTHMQTGGHTAEIARDLAADRKTVRKHLGPVKRQVLEPGASFDRTEWVRRVKELSPRLSDSWARSSAFGEVAIMRTTGLEAGHGVESPGAGRLPSKTSDWRPTA